MKFLLEYFFFLLDLVPNCNVDEVGVVELSLFHGYVLTANLWEVTEVANCEWLFSTASSNLSFRLDALISTKGEEAKPDFRFVILQDGELLHDLTYAFQFCFLLTPLLPDSAFYGFTGCRTNG